MTTPAYTGIGSRATPAPVCGTMIRIACHLARRGYTLRSGGASGADTAFEMGAWTANGRCEVYHARRKEYTDAEWTAAEAIAARHHPAWDRVSPGKRIPLIRNPFQVAGLTLDAPSAFIVFWAPEDSNGVVGGTRIAVHYARELGIPTFNLIGGTDALKRHLKEIGL